ncbi:Replication factor A protein 3-like protein, partial [Euroglyphus maynei]
MVMDVDDTVPVGDGKSDCAVRINGALMNNYQNCLAIIIGFVQRLEGENKRIVIKTTDGVYVQVILSQP